MFCFVTSNNVSFTLFGGVLNILETCLKYIYECFIDVFFLNVITYLGTSFKYYNIMTCEI